MHDNLTEHQKHQHTLFSTPTTWVEKSGEPRMRVTTTDLPRWQEEGWTVSEDQDSPAAPVTEAAPAPATREDRATRVATALYEQLIKGGTDKAAAQQAAQKLYAEDLAKPE